MSNSWDQQPDDSDDFMSGGKPSLKFENIGDTQHGIVTKVTKVPATNLDGVALTWPDGNPKYVFVFELDGTSNVYVKGNMISAVKEALTAGGFQSPRGLHLTIQLYALGDPPKPGYNAPKLFRAKAEVAVATARPSAAAAPLEQW